MPLLRYNLADEVEITDGPCACGWRLPSVRVFGRSPLGYPVGSATVTQHRLEELVFTLPERYGVMFWRARAGRRSLAVQFEVPPEHRAAACPARARAVRDEYGIEPEVTALSPGGLVPLPTLTVLPDVLKPRALFGPDESWDGAVRYYS
jgi:phenylacetate-CoA ligase